MLNRTSKKLTEKWIGPYEVTQVTLNMVKLKLPKTLWIHLVVNVSQVKPYLGPLPGQPVSQLAQYMFLKNVMKNMKWTI